MAGTNNSPDASDLMIFARVLDAGSFSAAADRLGLPKSTVSRRIAALEQRLGERLFTRTTRRLRLTDLGQALAAHARRVDEEVAAVEALAEHRRAAPSGQLRVSMPGDFAMLMLPRMLARFSARYPAVELVLDLSPRRVDLIAEDFDLAIRMGSLPDDATLVARRVGEFAFGLVASPAYLAQHGIPSEPRQLAAHRGIRLLARSGEPAPLELARGTQRWSGTLPGNLAANSVGVLIQLALAGAGIAAVSLEYVAGQLARGELRRVLADWTMPPGTAWAVMPSRRLVPPKTRAFIEELAAELAGFGTGVAPQPDRGS